MSGLGSYLNTVYERFSLGLGAVMSFLLFVGHWGLERLLREGLAGEILPDIVFLAWLVLFFVVVFRRERHRRQHVEDLGRTVARQNTELRAVLDLSEALGRAFRVQEVASAARDAVMASTPTVGGEVFLWDERAKEMRLAASWGRLTQEEALGYTAPVGKALAEKVAQTFRPLLTADPSTGTVPTAPEALPPEERRAVYIPLHSGGRLLGAVGVICREGERVEEKLELLMAIGGEVALALDVAKLYERLREQAITDELTGLRNRRYLMERMEEELARARRYRRPLSVVLVDWDNLKQINDRFGHLEGDSLLARAGAKLRQSIRQSDVVTRYGGDEFVILLPDTDADGAVELAERVRREFEVWKPEFGGEPVDSTLSLGVATSVAPEDDVNDLLRRADEALYRAKAAGRNRVSR